MNAAAKNKNIFHLRRWIGTGKPAFIFAVLLSAKLLGGEISVQAEANRDRIYLGESFILQLNISDAGAAEADLASIPNCRIRHLGTRNTSSFSISYIQGQMTRQGFTGLIISYEITPLTAGEFHCAPIKVTADGKNFTVTGPVLAVTDIEQQEFVKISINSTRETVLIDEPFEITFSIRILRLPGQFAEIEPLFPNNPPHLAVPWLNGEAVTGLKGPDLKTLLNRRLIQNKTPGFQINDYTRAWDPFDLSGFFAGAQRRALFALERRAVRENERDYIEYYLTLSYTPQDEGNYVFGPVVFKGAVPVSAQNDGTARGADVFAVAPACTVRVLPPPDEGRPCGFTGAIGSNLTVSAAFDTSSCNVGDPLNLTLSLAGQARFDKMLPPKLNLQTNLTQHFMIYENTVQTIRQGDMRQFVYTLRPLRPGTIEVPPLEVPYYDLQMRAYQTAHSAPLQIDVRQGSEITATNIVGHTNQTVTLGNPQTDWRKQTPATIRTTPAGAQPQALFGNHAVLIILAGSGPLLFALTCALQAFAQRRDARRKARLRKNALARALRRLEQNHSPACMPSIIRDYIAERTGLPSASITPNEAQTILEQNGVAANHAAQIRQIFEFYFNCAFQQQSRSANPPTDCATLRQILTQIDRNLRKLARNE